MDFTNYGEKFSENKKENAMLESKKSPSYQFSICKFDHEKIMSDSNNITIKTTSMKQPSSPDNESKLYTISENIFGIYCASSKSKHNVQQETIFKTMLEIKESFKNAKIKLYCLSEVCPETLKLCEAAVSFCIDLNQPPKLKSILVFCESIFDWLAKTNENCALIYCQDSASIIVLMIYAYSCYYEALPRRDLRLSMSLKMFITSNNKLLEKVPVSFRRYGGYMSLYSCMNQLQSLRSSVYLYCLILYSLPSMEPDIEKSSQIFFKFYTNDPLSCIHTTKLYCLQASVNRLVILFDHIPISLQNDSMIVCYHRCSSGNRRIKLFRLNFHTCQAISDMLTFHCQDFEDIYPACSMKMKLDLYLRETAVFGEGENDFFCETSHSDLSSIERTDSYTFLDNQENNKIVTSSVILNNKMEYAKNSDERKFIRVGSQRDSTSITIYKTSIEDQRESNFENSSIKENVSIINQSGQISGPIDSYHSTKLDTVRTSSSVLNGSGKITNDFKSSNYNYGNRNQQNQSFTNTDRDKCSKQLDNLMKDLNLDNNSVSNIPKNNSSVMMLQENNNEHFTQSISNKTNDRELKLMTELLEAQKEISNLRRSMNHLDILDQSTNHGFLNKPTANNFQSNSRYKSMTKGSVSGSIPDTYHYSPSRNNNWSHNNLSTISCGSPNLKTTKLNVAPNNLLNIETSSINEFQENRQTGYSAHRENLERDRMMKEKYLKSERNAHQNFHDETTEVFEEVETINLQPIGKGIQDLAKGNSQYRLPAKADSTSQFFNDNIGGLSPVSTRKYMIQNRPDSNSNLRLNNEIGSTLMNYNTQFQGQQQNMSLQLVEEKMQYWYQPNITRDEAINILKYCNPGSFLIRDSNSYSGAYGLAIKVATIPQNIVLKSDDLESEKVRHYLIELIGNQGVCFKGFPEEPVFPSLSHLVLYYTHTTSVLPCLLVLPEKRLDNTELPKLNKNNVSTSSVVISSPKFSFNKKTEETGYSVYYLGCYDVEYITGPSVINKAVERLLEHIDARRFTECQLRINTGEGIVLTDLERKLFFRRHHPFSSIAYCATDPKDRKIELDLCKSKGIKKTKIFGIIVKAYMAGENKCFLFGELDPTHKANLIVKIINEQMQKSTEN